MTLILSRVIRASNPPKTVQVAYTCRAYPDTDQAAQLSRTFGCVRLVWNTTLDARQRRYHAEGMNTSHQEIEAELAR